MSIQDGLIFKGDRIVVPTSMQTETKERLHSSHIGVQGCLRRARETVYRPNMNADIESYISRCSTCNSIQRSQAKEPMSAHAIPELPWQHVACDLFECDGADYVVLVDYYSDFFEIDRLSDKRSNEVVRKLKAHFARHGCPETLCSNNGPPFNSKDFANFAEDFGFEHNEFAAIPEIEREVGECRESSENVDDGIERCENRLLLGRRTRTKLPIAKRMLKPETCTRVVEKLLEKKERQAFYYDRGAKELKSLERGQVVRFRPPGYRKWKKAVVDDQTDVKSYAIRTEDGRRNRRNRSHLRTTAESFSETAQQMLEQQQHPPNENPPFNNEDDANVPASTTTTVRETTCTPVQQPDARSPPRQRVS